MKKIDPRLPSLPSLEDLLAHPTVQGAVDRLNQTTIAQRATGFIDELRESLADRAGSGIVPTAEQLAERLVRRLLGARSTTDQVINATGVVGGNPQLAPPLAEAALHRLIQVLGEFHRVGETQASRCRELLCQATGADAAWVTHSFGEAKAACERTADHQIVFARDAGLMNPQQWGLPPIATISAHLQDAEAAVCCGSGMLGGPPCGIVVGRREVIDSIAKSKSDSWPTLGAEQAVALTATLEIYAAEDHAEHQIPLLQLLSTPLENLQQRSERLATLLGSVASIELAESIQCESAWWSGETESHDAPSWAIAIRFKSGTGDARMKQLAASSPGLLTRAEGDRLLIDLRPVFPRWDQQLIAAVEGLE